jgi:hypothetical protein
VITFHGERLAGFAGCPTELAWSRNQRHRRDGLPRIPAAVHVAMEELLEAVVISQSGRRSIEVPCGPYRIHSGSER